MNDVCGRLGSHTTAIEGRNSMNHDIDTVRAPVLREGPCNTPSLGRLRGDEPRARRMASRHPLTMGSHGHPNRRLLSTEAYSNMRTP